MSLCELWFREQWLEKKFVFNVVSFLFDTCDFLINSRLFVIIVSRGTLPIYILSEIADNLSTLTNKGIALVKWRQFIYKLKRLQDVNASSEEGAPTYECCICLGEIKRGKQLSCSHVFHLVCLRSWLIEKVECPTCRKPIQLDRQPEPPGGRRRMANQNLEIRLRLQREQRRNNQRAPDIADQNPRPNDDGSAARDDNTVDETLAGASGDPEVQEVKPKPPKVIKGNPRGIFEEATKEKKRVSEPKETKEFRSKELGDKDARVGLLADKTKDVTSESHTEVETEKEKRLKALEKYRQAVLGIDVRPELSQNDKVKVAVGSSPTEPLDNHKGVAIDKEKGLAQGEQSDQKSERSSLWSEKDAGDKEGAGMPPS